MEIPSQRTLLPQPPDGISFAFVLSGKPLERSILNTFYVLNIGIHLRLYNIYIYMYVYMSPSDYSSIFYVLPQMGLWIMKKMLIWSMIQKQRQIKPEDHLLIVVLVQQKNLA